MGVHSAWLPDSTGKRCKLILQDEWSLVCSLLPESHPNQTLAVTASSNEYILSEQNQFCALGLLLWNMAFFFFFSDFGPILLHFLLRFFKILTYILIHKICP